MKDMQAWIDHLNEMEMYYHIVDNEIQIPTRTYTMPTYRASYKNFQDAVTEKNAVIGVYDTPGVLHMQFTDTGSFIGVVFTIAQDAEVI